MQTIGVIPAAASFGMGPVGAMSPLLGVPLLLWSVNNLGRVLPWSSIIVAEEQSGSRAAALHEPARALLAALGVRIAAPDERIDVARVLLCDPAMPFCSEATVSAALDIGAREVATFQTSAFERLRIGGEGELALARAVAAGLAPDHPCLAGLARFRLCLARGGAPVDVRAVISDVDGVLTNGLITLTTTRLADGAGSAEGGAAESKAFHMHDGMGVRLLEQSGILVGWISAGKDNGLIRRRAEMLGVAKVDVGVGDKGERFEKMCADLGVAPANTLYIGDDVNDLPAIQRAGLSACPADARPEVRSAVDLVLSARGGAGCFREAADLALAGRATERQRSKAAN